MYTNEKDMIKVLEIICSKTFYNDELGDYFDFHIYQKDLDVQNITIHLFDTCVNTLAGLYFLKHGEYPGIPKADLSEKLKVFQKENPKEYIRMKIEND
jgi:hypothetical protein